MFSLEGRADIDFECLVVQHTAVVLNTNAICFTYELDRNLSVGIDRALPPENQCDRSYMTYTEHLEQGIGSVTLFISQLN